MFNLKNDAARKVLLYAAADGFGACFSVIFSYILWWQGVMPGSHPKDLTYLDGAWFARCLPAAVLLTLAANALFGLYGNLWKYASIDECLKVFLSACAICLLLYFYDYFLLGPMRLNDISRRMFFLCWVIMSALFAFSRFGYRMVKRFFIVLAHLISSKANLKRVMVVGASYAGYGVIKDMGVKPRRDAIAVIVVDADAAKFNTSLAGVRVTGPLERIPEIASSYEVDEIIIAIPGAPPDILRRAADNALKTHCSLKILPPMEGFSSSQAAYSRLREVSVSDLLYRDEVKIDTKNISDYIKNKTVLLTGGGGFIGSAMCSEIAKFAPARLVIFDICENGAFDAARELGVMHPDLNVVIRIGSVRDLPRLEEVFAEFCPHVVFHLAAHKHVHLMEENVCEAVKNNVFGTLYAAEAAKKAGVERFVLISSDKAVNPANAYGATKKIAELVMERMAAKKSETKFITVRFGNVLGASGSVLNSFKAQIALGGPVTITGPADMTRYFMTAGEAAALTLQAAGLGQTGRILVLDMGAPVNIADLARKMIVLSGYAPERDIKIVHTELRPGDKTAEELLTNDERAVMRAAGGNKKIMVIKPAGLNLPKFERDMARLKAACEAEPPACAGLLKEIVPNYV